MWCGRGSRDVWASDDTCVGRVVKKRLYYRRYGRRGDRDNVLATLYVYGYDEMHGAECSYVLLPHL